MFRVGIVSDYPNFDSESVSPFDGVYLDPAEALRVQRRVDFV